ncbi:MAG: PIN domain-containing protein [Candidatus Brocadiia bacterium]
MLYILRAFFVLAAAVIGYNIEHLFTPGSSGVIGIVIGVLVAILFSVIEIGFTRRFISTISIVMFGLVFGFIISALFIHALLLVPTIENMTKDTPGFNEWLQVSITFLFCFLSVIAIIRSKDDFKFIIPFVELSKSQKTGLPLVVDTSVIIDGRFADIAETLHFDMPIIIPRFVLQELQNLADSSDKMRRVRGRHGLDILDKMRKNTKLKVQIDEAEFPYIKETDNKLLKLSQSINGRLVTNDFNLLKVARVQGMDVISINELANALKPVVLPGEQMEVKIIRTGEEPSQGVGYLNDGTMVVVEGAANRIGQRLNVNVTSVLQTNAGKMIFSSLERERDQDRDRDRDRDRGDRNRR